MDCGDKEEKGRRAGAADREVEGWWMGEIGKPTGRAVKTKRGMQGESEGKRVEGLLRTFELRNTNGRRKGNATSENLSADPGEYDGEVEVGKGLLVLLFGASH